MTEPEILQDLVSKWVSLGLEYAQGAPNVTALYVYVSSERGSVYPEIFFEQNGKVVYPSDLEGIAVDVEQVRSLHRLQYNDLTEAETNFARLNVPAPTGYRVYYETASGKLDVQLSRDLIYASDPDKIPEHGIVDWLGERAPKLY